MNRRLRADPQGECRVPYMCGDEPDVVAARIAAEHAFPTCVGMNRSSSSTMHKGVCVPYMCGDEPGCATIRQAVTKRSLHVWG